MPEKRRIYLDYASGAPMDKRVEKEFVKTLKIFANPTSLYKEAQEAKKKYENARKKIADILSARPNEIIFTSGATEANNLALFGIVNKAREEGIKNPHIIISSIEHKSILETCKELSKRGVEISFIDPDQNGKIDPKKVREALKENTVLVSIMYVNNEIGTVEPIKEIAKEIRRHKKTLSFKPKTANYPFFHTDACQAENLFSLNVLELGVDMMTLHSPKVYGPAGVGALFLKSNIEIAPIIFGGGQEKGLRSGRENTALAYAFAKALEISQKEKDKEKVRLEKMRKYFIQKIQKQIPNVLINGDDQNYSPHIVSVTIEGLDAEFAVISLDHEGVAVSSASSCMNTSEDSYSYVIEKIRGNKKNALSTLRISFGRFTTKKDLDDCLKALFRVISRQWNPSDTAEKLSK